MSDLFGFSHPSPQFADIRNQKPVTAEKKAVLCKQLGELLRTVPASICNADVKATREWKDHHARAKKVFSNAQASVNDLQVAVNQMSSYSARRAA